MDICCIFRHENSGISTKRIAAGAVIGTVALAASALLVRRYLNTAAKLPRVEAVSLEWKGLSAGLSASLQDLNTRAAELSAKVGRTTLNPKELAAFVDPTTPMDAILKKQRDLGSGCFRRVWQVEAASGLFAMKATNPLDLSWDPNYLGNWINSAKREFELGLSIHHSNIMKTHHFAIKREGDYLHAYTLCELIPGSTLFDTTLDATARHSVGQQAKQLAEQMHELQVAVRDLHSENVMITTDNILKFIDIEFWEVSAPAHELTYAAKEWAWLFQLIG